MDRRDNDAIEQNNKYIRTNKRINKRWMDGWMDEQSIHIGIPFWILYDGKVKATQYCNLIGWFKADKNQNPPRWKHHHFLVLLP